MIIESKSQINNEDKFMKKLNFETEMRWLIEEILLFDWWRSQWKAHPLLRYFRDMSIMNAQWEWKKADKENDMKADLTHRGMMQEAGHLDSDMND